ncbi:MAG TPA: ATP-binding cassette domain-containing protein [Candidatus Limnocylindria bacterium]|nr:ATP-binding cassette domain-containing protein [Candidatus Limnocylindria bacterium]
MSDTAVLSVNGVFKSFTDVRAVQGISFEVRPGEIFGFLGPNGAGKTTTLRMIMEITRPDQGEVLFEGKPGLDRSRVGYLPEERGLFEDGTLIDTLVYLGTLRRMSRRDAAAAAREWLERLGLADRIKAKVGTLSKGNQQKVQFAGAILHRPALAVLDEPFSGLDPLNQELFIGLIRELRDQGSAMLISAHQLNLVERLCDRLLLISQGRALLSGTLAELRASAVGGADEVVTLELRAIHAGQSDDLSRLILAAAPAAQHQVHAEPNGVIRVEVSLPSRADLSPLLAEISARYRVERVTMREVSLHEIYVRAVGGDVEDERMEEAAHV